jgi:hypothetical protein
MCTYNVPGFVKFRNSTQKLPSTLLPLTRILFTRAWAEESRFCHIRMPRSSLECVHLAESAVYNALFGASKGMECCTLWCTKGTECCWNVGDCKENQNASTTESGKLGRFCINKEGQIQQSLRILEF